MNQKPSPQFKLHLYFNEQITFWSAWFHLESVKLCLFEFSPRSQLLDFPLDFFSLQLGGPGGRNQTSTTMLCGVHLHLPEFWILVYFNKHVHRKHAMPHSRCMLLLEDVHLVVNKKEKERKHCEEMTKTKSNEDVFEI